MRQGKNQMKKKKKKNRKIIFQIRTYEKKKE